MRTGLRLAMLAWVTAVLVVAPVLAASDCRACCSETSSVSQSATMPADAGCAHRTPVTHPACCTTSQVARANAPTGPNCPQCPRCEGNRPAPLGTVPSAPMLVDLGMTWSSTVEMEPSLAPGVSAVVSMEAIPQRSANVLFSRWLI
ncbi:MAG: hypothetical protein Q8K78_14290 [Planctomycetaceae bacterium]|nr:hypothetical protein [Planctomycetaceae bacterium]